MPHVPQPVAEPESPPQETGGEPPERESPETPEGPAPAEALPSLAIADVGAAEGDGTLTFTVSLSFAGGEPVTVRYATENGTATAGSDYAAASGTLTFPADSTAARTIGVAVTDDAVAEGAETFTVRLSEPHGATIADAVATGTISDDDARSVTVQPEELNVTEGASGTYTVVLGSRPTAAVTVLVTSAAEVAVVPEALVFTAGDWATAQTVTATAEQDEDAVADAPVELVHTVQGGNYAGAPAAPVVVTIVEDDTQSLAVASALATEGAGVLRFAVSLSLESDAEVTVDYATADVTAAAGVDYTPASGTLRFPARSTVARMIEVTVNDDEVDEPDEQLTVTLTRPVNAILAGGGESAGAIGTIEDDDDPPELSIAGASVSEGGGSMRFAVTLGRASARTVTVHYASADDTATAGDYTAVSGMLTFAAGNTGLQIAVPVSDDAMDEADEQLTVTLSAAVYATVDSGAKTATGTIEDDDDPPELDIADASVSEGGGSMRFAVTLSGPSGQRVTVDYATADVTAQAGVDYTQASGTLTFAAGTTAHTIAVPILADTVVEDTETFTVTLSNAHGATLTTATAAGTITDDDDPPELDIADASVSEGGGSMRFAVTLSGPSGQRVTVDYATADVTAQAGVDYTQASGTLTFAAGTTAHTIAVPILADTVVEDTETFTVTLSNAHGATLTTATAAGTITDAGTITAGDTRGVQVVQVEPVELVVHARGEPGRYTVALTSQPSAQVTVALTTDPVAARVSVSPTVLTFTATDWTRQTVSVTAAADAVIGGTLTIDHTVSGGAYAGESPSVAVTIAGPPPLGLGSLQVSGGGTMYPDFDGGVHHYAVPCDDPSTTIQLTAHAPRTGTQITLLRADEADNQVSTTGRLEAQVDVNSQHDIAIEVIDGDDKITYVVHCIPPDFPDIWTLKKTDEVSDGLLLTTVRYENPGLKTWVAVLDNNGVPRFHKPRTLAGTNLRYYPNGPTVNGKSVRYSVSKATVELLDEGFELIGTVQVASPLTNTDVHDFLIAENGNYLFISYHETERDLCEVPETCPKDYFDSIIQEVTPQGAVAFTWNSWDHINRADCLFQDGDYAHLNSLQLIDGDIVASFAYCHQILRIDRPSGAVVWQLGGSSPPRGDDTEYLEITGDTDGVNEFCGQHHATLTSYDSVVLFDNGTSCFGPRKSLPRFTRVVEYDISSGTQASFKRQYRLASKYGFSSVRGGATVVLDDEDDERWLIAWYNAGASVPLRERLALSEIDPATGTAHLHMHMSKDGRTASTYRAYRAPEADVRIPLNLP